MDRAEAMVCQHLYWPDIRNSVCTEVTNCDTCQRTKLKIKKMVNYLCVDLIGPYIKIRKGKKENLHIKSFTMIDPLTGWFEIG